MSEHISKTRFPELGYRRFGADWRIVTTEDGEVVGPYYASKAEMLADLDRFAAAYGCGNGAPVTAPGPWARLRESARAEVGVCTCFRDRDEDGCPACSLREALAALPDPREADAAGEALDELERLVSICNSASADCMHATARSILRRAGRLS